MHSSQADIVVDDELGSSDYSSDRSSRSSGGSSFSESYNEGTVSGGQSYSSQGSQSRSRSRKGGSAAGGDDQSYSSQGSYSQSGGSSGFDESTFREETTLEGEASAFGEPSYSGRSGSQSQSQSRGSYSQRSGASTGREDSTFRSSASGRIIGSVSQNSRGSETLQSSRSDRDESTFRSSRTGTLESSRSNRDGDTFRSSQSDRDESAFRSSRSRTSQSSDRDGSTTFRSSRSDRDESTFRSSRSDEDEPLESTIPSSRSSGPDEIGNLSSSRSGRGESMFRSSQSGPDESTFQSSRSDRDESTFLSSRSDVEGHFFQEEEGTMQGEDSTFSNRSFSRRSGHSGRDKHALDADVSELGKLNGFGHTGAKSDSDESSFLDESVLSISRRGKQNDNQKSHKLEKDEFSIQEKNIFGQPDQNIGEGNTAGKQSASQRSGASRRGEILSQEEDALNEEDDGFETFGHNSFREASFRSNADTNSKQNTDDNNSRNSFGGKSPRSQASSKRGSTSGRKSLRSKKASTQGDITIGSRSPQSPGSVKASTQGDSTIDDQSHHSFGHQSTSTEEASTQGGSTIGDRSNSHHSVGKSPSARPQDAPSNEDTNSRKDADDTGRLGGGKNITRVCDEGSANGGGESTQGEKVIRFQPACKSIAVLGTMSDAGKSIITAGLCRVLSNGGVRVAPFKGQNMSNNASPALLPDPDKRKRLYKSLKKAVGGKVPKASNKQDTGYGEIGVAQTLQAEACRLVPRVEMNPVLLKSGGQNKDGESLCSVVVLGKQIAAETYIDLGKRTTTLLGMVLGSHTALARATGCQVVVLDGSGSCTELNSIGRDIVNLPLVRQLQCSWFLVANTDCGGVFAQIVGTKMCVSQRDWTHCVGIIVNKLRGEAKNFEPGPKIIEQMVGKPVFVVPFLHNLNLPEEDGLGLERRLSWENEHKPPTGREPDNEKKPIVVVVAYPHTAIADDICPLERDPRFQVQWRRRRLPRPYPHTSAVILPGSRSTRLDLKWLHDSGWVTFLRKHVAAGGSVLGLCGGYQMLGWSIDDPTAAEGAKGAKQGLGLLPIVTVIAPPECKVISPKKGTLFPSKIKVEGFELHCGQSEILVQSNFAKDERIHPLVLFEDGKPEGMCSGRVKGTYLNGILQSAEARVELLVAKKGCFPLLNEIQAQDPLDRFAAHLESCGLTFEAVTRMIDEHHTN